MVAGISRATIFSNSVLLMYSIEGRTVAIQTRYRAEYIGEESEKGQHEPAGGTCIGARASARFSMTSRRKRQSNLTLHSARALKRHKCRAPSLNQQRARRPARLSGKTVAQIFHDLVVQRLAARGPAACAGE